MADGTMSVTVVRHPHGGQLGLVFKGTSRPAGPPTLLDRHYVGGTGSWTAFVERFTAACAALGVYQARRTSSCPTVRRRSARSGSAASRRGRCRLVSPHQQLRFAIGRSTRRSSRPRWERRCPRCRGPPAILRSHARRRAGRPRAGAPLLFGHRLRWDNRRGIATTASSRWPAPGPWRRPSTSPSPALQDAGHELVPPRREPPASPQAAAAQRHLGPLLGGAHGRIATSLARHGLSVSTEN